MAIVRMQKVGVVTHKSNVDKILHILHDAGVMEIIEAKEKERSDTTKSAYEKAELAFAKEYLLPFANKETLQDMHKLGHHSEIEASALSMDFKALIARVKEIEEEKQHLEARRKESHQRQRELLPWKYYPYAQNVSEAPGHTAVLLGMLPTGQLEHLKQELQEKLPKTAILPLAGENEEETGVVAHVWKDEKKAFEELSAEHGWTEASVHLHERKTVSEELDDAQQMLKEIDQRESVLHKELMALSKELPNVSRLEVHMKWLDQKRQAREALHLTRDTAMLMGWVPKKEIPHLEAKLHEAAKATALLKLKQEDGEEAPVMLKNSKLVKPFESVTNLYGLPLPTEMDPTSALAPFFILFFALCLTDAGYGLVLALLFGTVIAVKKMRVSDQPLIWLLFLSGIVTVIVSIPFGGWFGLMPTQVPESLTYVREDGTRLFLGQIWNLSEEAGISFLQNLSIALGLTHLSFGMFLAGYHKWIHGRRVEALWTDFTSHALIGTAIFALFAPADLKQIALYAVYAALALFIWGKGYGSKWYLRPVFGLIGLMNFAVGMLSNTLSYLRLLALGLVTGAIALAVNQVAIEMGKLFPLWLAIPVIVIILFMGHLVSIALNTLGSFIHSGRLQFIEFFSQFFEGGGKAFSPFKRSTTH